MQEPSIEIKNKRACARTLVTKHIPPICSDFENLVQTLK